jgi:hypothetical protein
MKTILILVICGSGLWFCNTKAEQQQEKIKGIAFSRNDSIDFKTQIQPILQKNCMPCHFPGGKQYEKLPFDQAETIIRHEAGALKRLKDGNDIAFIKQFIKQNTIAN